MGRIQDAGKVVGERRKMPNGREERGFLNRSFSSGAAVLQPKSMNVNNEIQNLNFNCNFRSLVF